MRTILGHLVRENIWYHHSVWSSIYHARPFASRLNVLWDVAPDRGKQMETSVLSAEWGVLTGRTGWAGVQEGWIGSHGAGVVLWAFLVPSQSLDTDMIPQGFIHTRPEARGIFSPFYLLHKEKLFKIGPPLIYPKTVFFMFPSKKGNTSIFEFHKEAYIFPLCGSLWFLYIWILPTQILSHLGLKRTYFISFSHFWEVSLRGDRKSRTQQQQKS